MGVQYAIIKNGPNWFLVFVKMWGQKVLKPMKMGLNGSKIKEKIYVKCLKPVK